MNIELDKVVCHFKTKFPEVRIVKGIITDIFPKEGPERNLLVAVYESGHVEKLVTMPDCKKSNFDAAVSAIVNETFLGENPVKEALTMWLKAYNELELKKKAEVGTSSVQVNPEEALKWLRKAAELGNQEAMLKLGNFLYKDKRSFGEIINDYEARIKQISEKEYTDGYNDAIDGKRNKYAKEKPIVYQNVKVGDVIKFGSYPQNYRDKKEPIEWHVLDVREGKAFLISKYGLDCKKYNEKNESTSWEKCTLRKWLNDDFLNSAFSNVEKNTIFLSNVTADKNPEYSTYQGLDAEDKVFLLSVKEAERYFKSIMDRKCYPTKIAVDNGASKDDEGQCWWWLRSMGYGSLNVSYVNPGGSVRYYGLNVYNYSNAVRPALWINLKS